MPNLKISEMAEAVTLTGDELVEVVQAGANVRTTVAALVSLFTPTGVQEEDVTGAEAVAINGTIGFLDLTPSSAGTLTNITGAIDGQIVVVSNVSASESLVIQQNANIRILDDLILFPRGSFTMRYSDELALWVGLS